MVPAALGTTLKKLAQAGPGQINLSNGNLLVPVPITKAGPFAAQPTLFYNSLTPAASEFGAGWSNLHKQSVASSFGATAVTTTVFDADGRAKAVINPLGFRYSTVFDAASQPVATIDPLARRNTTVFDAAGRTKATINGLGFRATLLYDSASQNTAVVDALGRRTTTLFDLAGRQHATVDAMNFRTTVGFDAASRPVTRTNAIGAVVTTVYDAASGVRATVDGTGARTTMGYDAASQRVSVQNPLGWRRDRNPAATSRRVKPLKRQHRLPLGHRVARLSETAQPSKRVEHELDQPMVRALRHLHAPPDVEAADADEILVNSREPIRSSRHVSILLFQPSVNRIELGARPVQRSALQGCHRAIGRLAQRSAAGERRWTGTGAQPGGPTGLAFRSTPPAPPP